MARIRSVHPGLFTDEAFVSVSPLARVLFIGLWTECDDQGAFEWKPVTIKMRLLPVDNADIPALLTELTDADMVKRYSASGREYGAVRNFAKYQRPKKPNSVHPIPPEFRTYVGSSGGSSELDGDEEHQSSEPSRVKPPPVPQKTEKSPQMEGREGESRGPTVPNGTFGESAPDVPSKRGAAKRLSDDWAPSLDDRAFAKTLGFSDPGVDYEAGKFRDFWRGKPGKDGTKADWPSTWRNWMRRALEQRGKGPPVTKTTSGTLYDKGL